MHACAYGRTYGCTYGCNYVCMYACMYVCNVAPCHVCMYVSMCVRMCAYIYLPVPTYVHLNPYLHLYSVCVDHLCTHPQVWKPTCRPPGCVDLLSPKSSRVRLNPKPKSSRGNVALGLGFWGLVC